ncbi:hypothetical protein SDC49_01385 [Lactobacillus sp. R2/2]|nr:hypothetical protein [Lactobacillus sp. R2/2]
MLKTKLALFTALIGVFLTTTGFASPNIKDNSNLLERETSKLILAKNDRYFQTSEQPQIIVKTVNRVDHLTPAKLNKYKRTVFIVVGTKIKSAMCRYIPVKILHSAFSC